MNCAFHFHYVGYYIFVYFEHHGVLLKLKIIPPVHMYYVNLSTVYEKHHV